jgi:hypothetical protein
VGGPREGEGDGCYLILIDNLAVCSQALKEWIPPQPLLVPYLKNQIGGEPFKPNPTRLNCPIRH